MNRQDRIKLDKQSLIKEGYKKIKLINLFDYNNDHETSVTVYRAKLGKEKHFKYFFPIELNPDVLWEKITKELDYNILSYHSDFLIGGLIFNALIEEDGKKKILLIKYSPETGEIQMKEAVFDG